MNIATGYGSPIVAFVKSTDSKGGAGRLRVFDIEAKKLRTEFPVQYDVGGRRLAIGRDAQCCYVGCYHQYGLACYSIVDGSELWRRKDLRPVQQVVAFPLDDFVFCGRDRGQSGQVVCGRTGATLKQHGSVRAVYASPFSRQVVVSAKMMELHSPFGSRIARIERTTFAEMDCCFSRAEVMVTESTGPLRCFDLESGALLWTHQPKEGSHFLHIEFCERAECFVGVWWRYEDNSDPVQRAFHFECRSGRILREVSLGEGSVRRAFCQAGATLFNSDLSIQSVETGEVIYRFEE